MSLKAVWSYSQLLTRCSQLFFASGFAALIYEVSWNRQLGLLFGYTASAAAVVLAAYFGGMAIGYAVGGRVASRVCPFRGYAVCEFAPGIWTLSIPAVIQFVTQADVDAWLQADNASLRTLSRVLFVCCCRHPQQSHWAQRCQ